MATKLGWNFEHLRAAMGHEDYAILQRYVRLATERDLGAAQGLAGVRHGQSGHGVGVAMGESVKRTPLTENELLFSQWWGRYVMDLTYEEIAAGAASSVVLRAAETAWKANALLLTRRVAAARRVRGRRSK